MASYDSAALLGTGENSWTVRNLTRGKVTKGSALAKARMAYLRSLRGKNKKTSGKGILSGLVKLPYKIYKHFKEKKERKRTQQTLDALQEQIKKLQQQQTATKGSGVWEGIMPETSPFIKHNYHLKEPLDFPWRKRGNPMTRQKYRDLMSGGAIISGNIPFYEWWKNGITGGPAGTQRLREKKLRMLTGLPDY